MLAYNFRKHNFQKSDHVREILAKLDAKQSKTGLSLYNQVRTSNNSTPSTPGDSPNYEDKTSFPSLKRARKKAKKRITTDSHRYQSNQEQYTRAKHIPHRLPGNNTTVNLPPVTSIQKPEERIQQPSNIPDQQFDKEKLDINLNPFGYNRKTLAFQTRKINYVVEWPETWPFKITSFQGKKKTLHHKRPLPHKNTSSIKSLSVEDEELPNEPGKARVLAPVDHPIKQHAVSSKPYVESSLVRRGVRRPQAKEDGSRFVLKSRGKDTEVASRRDDNLSRNEPGKNVAEDKDSQCLPSMQSPMKPEISREQMDSCPPSTPVPSGQDPVPNGQDSGPDGQEPQKDEDQSSDDLRQEASSLLNDIVNQIISESQPLSI